MINRKQKYKYPIKELEKTLSLYKKTPYGGPTETINLGRSFVIIEELFDITDIDYALQRCEEIREDDRYSEPSIGPSHPCDCDDYCESYSKLEVSYSRDTTEADKDFVYKKAVEKIDRNKEYARKRIERLKKELELYEKRIGKN
jgi:hypothetical protein